MPAPDTNLANLANLANVVTPATSPNPASPTPTPNPTTPASSKVYKQDYVMMMKEGEGAKEVLADQVSITRALVAGWTQCTPAEADRINKAKAEADAKAEAKAKAEKAAEAKAKP